MNVDGETIRVKLEDYMGDAHYEAVADPKGKPLFNLMVTGAQGAQQITLKRGNSSRPMT